MSRIPDGTQPNEFAIRVAELTPSGWSDANGNILAPSDVSAFVLDPRINFPIMLVGQCPDGFLVRADAFRTKTGIAWSLGEYREGQS